MVDNWIVIVGTPPPPQHAFEARSIPRLLHELQVIDWSCRSPRYFSAFDFLMPIGGFAFGYICNRQVRHHLRLHFMPKPPEIIYE